MAFPSRSGLVCFCVCALGLVMLPQSVATVLQPTVDHALPTVDCRLLTYIPFTDLRPGPAGRHANAGQYGYGNWPNETALGRASISLLAAAEMARRHFNERNPVLVPELELPFYQNCPVRIPDDSLYKDSGYVRTKTVSQFLALANPGLALPNSETQQASSTNHSLFGPPNLGFCAVVGPMDANAHAGLSVVTEQWGLPQLAYSTTNLLLSRRDLYPNFVRLIPDATDFAKSLAYAAHGDSIWKRRFVFILYEPEYGEQFEDVIEVVKNEQVSYETEQFLPGNEAASEEAFRKIRDSGYRTIMVTINHFALLDDIARLAVKYNLVGPEFLWILTGDALPDTMRETLTLEAGSDLDRWLDGAYVFSNYDLFFYRDNDRFLQEWRAQNSSFVKGILERQPMREDRTPYVQTLPIDYFEENKPAVYASFLYDSVMAAGLGACDVLKKSNVEQGSFPGDLKGMKKFLVSILNSNFTGASGPVYFKQTGTNGADDETQHESTRDDSTALYGMHNIRSIPHGGSLRRYESVLVATFDASKGKWEKTGEQFLYSGGTDIEPFPLITVRNFNYLGKYVQISGFIKTTLALLICFGSAAWIYQHREYPIIKTSQPEFLYLLCLGSALVAFSLVFISFDEDKGWTSDQLSRACATFPWFFVLGYAVSYFALVCKMWRLSQLLHMTDQSGNIKRALIPFAVVTFCMIALLTIWQIYDPLQWKREVFTSNPTVSYGECQMESDALIFIIPLGILILLAMGATAVLSWQLRDVRPDLAESRWIFFGIFGHLQVWAIGIPLFLVADDASRDASYILTSSLCFILSTTLVVCVIWPKVFMYYKAQKIDDGRLDSWMEGLQQRKDMRGPEDLQESNSSIHDDESGNVNDNALSERNSHDEQENGRGNSLPQPILDAEIKRADKRI